MDDIKRGIEAVLFVADEPIATADLAVLFEVSAVIIEQTLQGLQLDFDNQNRGVVIRQVAGGWRMATHPSVSEYLERFVTEHRNPRLSQASLETLAIIAYRQPVSRAQIAEIRGVSSEGVLKTLVSRGIVEEIGRDDGPGLAILYGTTPQLLERLGINSLSDLPPLAALMPDQGSLEKMESGLGPGV
ncbi:MAG TPA: SMC-Scp complex subunit ScpB [Actinomycetota bacterium]|nr:SMC-Scp complex subunit ScpB [Actinomycetota bacterium]